MTDEPHHVQAQAVALHVKMVIQASANHGIPVTEASAYAIAAAAHALADASDDLAAAEQLVGLARLFRDRAMRQMAERAAAEKAGGLH